MIRHINIGSKNLLSQIRQGRITFGGNIQLKIYGRLDCSSGKRMKKVNRTFFSSLSEAVKEGYRPCGHCMNQEYKKWKNETI